MSQTPRKVVVLGGGVSGLSFAYYLNVFKNNLLSVKNSRKPQITILEKSGSIGGWMQSDRDGKSGAVFEYGPRSLRASGLEARSSLALIDELGLADKVISCKRNSPAGKNRLIYAKGKLNLLPTRVTSLFTTQSPFTKSIASYAVKELRVASPDSMKNVDESIYSFISRRFGMEIAEYLADPVFRGVIAGDIRKTSVKALLPRFKAVEDQYGSILRNFYKMPAPTTDGVVDSVLCRKALDEKWAIFSLQSGLGLLPSTLHKNLLSQGIDVRLKTPCTKLEHVDGRVKVYTANDCIEADLVVAAVNSATLSKLLSDYSSLSNHLSSLPIADVATVGLEYPKASVQGVPQAFGHLIPSCEDEPNLGVIYESVVFPQLDRDDKSTARFTCMIGGDWFNDVLGSNPTSSLVEDIAIKSVAKQLGIKDSPSSVKVNIIKEAIPQYPVGHGDIISSIDREIHEKGIPLTIIGPSYDQPGANHCIHRAKVQAKNILEQWDYQDYMSSVPSETKTS